MTPKSFLSFLEGYKTIYQERRDEILSSAERMSNGLTKLIDAADAVAILKTEVQIKVINILFDFKSFFLNYDSICRKKPLQ